MGTTFFDTIFNLMIENNLISASQINILLRSDPLQSKQLLEYTNAGAKIIDDNRISFMVCFFNALNGMGAKYNEPGWNFDNVNMPASHIDSVKKHCNRIMQLAMTTAFEPQKAMNGLLAMMYETNPSRAQPN
ncbi:hypothetical protein DK842_05690 [Chromobacterium phragmitis]|uniref:hypothetical protein n=1 Tax=Chromobacterium phragmitis TaxID=2202141 RepID=UPI000DECF05D|nr:hypothetical protein [Chromobacterium phragmitis]AXE29436.1 hypothetical protein DK842_05690 [Chromobacterium phragmitis]